MRLKYAAISTGLLAALLFASCKSTEVESPAEETPVEEVTVVETPVEETPAQETPKEVVVPEDFSDENKKLLELTEAARTKAVEVGAETYYPDILSAADSSYDELKKNVSENSTVDYSDAIKDLTAKYESLALAAEAQDLKKNADNMDFSSVDKSAYETGDKALSDYASLGASASGKDLLDKASAARDAYKLLVTKGFTALAGKERNAALAAKKNADSVKAGVAQKEIYTKASETFKKADSSYVTSDIEGAYNGYKASKETFEELYTSISERRAAAQAAIDRAKQKVADSENYALEADSVAPIEGDVAGIESEDAVLLEADNLADPDTAVIDVEDGITAEMAEKTAAAAILVDDTVNSAVDSAVDIVAEEASASTSEESVSEDAVQEENK